MASSGGKATSDLETLKATIHTTATLLTQLQASATSSSSSKNTEVNALDLAHDCASLVRAHTTKISLLIINKPFTATAITTVLRELVSGPLPGLASAVELCTAERYTKVMSKEVAFRVERVFKELEALVAIIPLDGKVLGKHGKNGGGGGREGSLLVTGGVWEACDKVVELKKLGVAGLVVKKAEEYRALLKDALEELQEWGEEESDEEEDVGSDREQDDAQAAIDDMFGSQRHIPTDDPEKIRPKLESSLKRLRLLITMYQAAVKRRFKTLPYLPHPEPPPELKARSGEDPRIVNCLDEVLNAMKKIPEYTDELASAFYELDGKEIDKRMDECFLAGFAAAELLMKNWEGQQDEFSTWALKFQVAMKKGW